MKTYRYLHYFIAVACLIGCLSCENLSIEKPDVEDHSISGQVFSLPDNFSLMKDILMQSGLSETLGDTTQSYTFFIQDNADFAAADIHNVNDLIEILRATVPEGKSDSALLVDYIKYRSIPYAFEVDSLLNSNELMTLADGKKIFLSIDKSTSPLCLKFNDLNGHLAAPDAVLDSVSLYSNLHCSNGIIYKIKGNLWAKNRTPYRVYWDIAEQPELMALPNFRQSGCNATFHADELSYITFQVDPDCPDDYDHIEYHRGEMPQDISTFNDRFQYTYADYLRLWMDMGGIQWIEFKTPVLVKGTYKVWLCYRRESDGTIRAVFKQGGYEDQLLPHQIDMSLYMPNPEAEGSSPEQLEMLGWKRYNAKKYSYVVASYLLGTIEVYETGRHTLRFEALSHLRCYCLGNWDMIQFIPVNENQLSPRIDMLGNWIEDTVEVCNIFPYEAGTP